MMRNTEYGYRVFQVGNWDSYHFQEWSIFYSVTVATIFFAVITIQIVSSNETLRIGIFVFWAVYGVIPTIHWMFAMGGWDNPIVQVLYIIMQFCKIPIVAFILSRIIFYFQKLLPRVINMYAISGLAFFIYMTYIPERFSPGAFKIHIYFTTIILRLL